MQPHKKSGRDGTHALPHAAEIVDMEIEFETQSCAYLRGFLVQLPFVFKCLIEKGYTPIGLRHRQEAGCYSLYVKEDPYLIEASSLVLIHEAVRALPFRCFQPGETLLYRSVTYGERFVKFLLANHVDLTWSIHTAQIELDGRVHHVRQSHLHRDRSAIKERMKQRLERIQDVWGEWQTRHSPKPQHDVMNGGEAGEASRD